MINRDSKLADKEGRNKSKNYENQIKPNLRSFERILEPLRRPAVTRSQPGLLSRLR